MNRPAIVVAFGETALSYLGSTGAVIDRHSYTWPFLLEQQLGRPQRPVLVRNSLTIGEPVRQALDRLEADCLGLQPDVVLLQFGQTDARLGENEQPATPSGRFRRDLERLVVRVRAAGARPVLVTPNPLTISFPDHMARAVSQARGVNFSLARYAAVTRAVAARHRVPLLDLFALLPRQPRWEELIFNGGCPNRAGSRFVAAALAPLVAAQLRQVPARPEAADWITIVAHGDSVTHSLGVKGVDRHGLAWRRLLERQLQAAGHPVVVRNSGIPCDRTVQAAGRFAADVLARRPRFVLICFGLNDAWITNRQQPVISIRRYGEKLREMVRAAKRRGVTPILVSPSPMTWVYYTNYFQRPVYRQRGVNCQVQALAREMARVARTERVGFVDLFRRFREHPDWNDDGNPLVADGLHPSPAGNRFWAAVLAEYLQKQLA